MAKPFWTSLLNGKRQTRTGRRIGSPILRDKIIARFINVIDKLKCASYIFYLPEVKVQWIRKRKLIATKYFETVPDFSMFFSYIIRILSYSMYQKYLLKLFSFGCKTMPKSAISTRRDRRSNNYASFKTAYFPWTENLKQDSFDYQPSGYFEC